MHRSLITRWLGTLLLAMTTVIAGVSVSSAFDHAKPRPPQGVVVHLGQALNDLHTAHMALALANNLADHQAKVTLFLDREGVRLADKRVPTESLIWAGETIEEQMTHFVEAGGAVLLCPGCSSNAGITEADVRPGATIATQDQVAEVIMAADKVVDY